MRRLSPELKVGFALLCVALLFESYPVRFGITVTAGRLTLIIVTFLWLFRVANLGFPVFVDRFVAAWMVAVIFFDAFTMLWGLDVGIALQALGVKLECFLVFTLTTSLLRNRMIPASSVRWVVGIWAANGVYALIQSAGQRYGFDTDIPFLRDNITSCFGSPALIDFYTVRARSFFHDPNTLAAVMAMAFPLCVAYAASAQLRSASFVGWGAGVFLCIGGLLVSYSRSGLLACSVGLLVYIALTIRHRAMRVVLPLAIVAVIAVQYTSQTSELTDPLTSRFDERDNSFQSHVRTIESGLSAFESSPVLGIGYGSFAVWDPIWLNPHNIYVSFLAETGVVGFLLEMSLVIYLLWIGLRRVLRTSGQERLFATGTLAAYCALLAFNNTYWFYYSSIPWMLMAIHHTGPITQEQALLSPPYAQSVQCSSGEPSVGMQVG